MMIKVIVSKAAHDKMIEAAVYPWKETGRQLPDERWEILISETTVLRLRHLYPTLSIPDAIDRLVFAAKGLN